ncbi:DoxX family membrane protein [Patescibacteria group bacterium]|nr:DoxX family membrane protein [Patescibacteria group bacterium]
MKDKSLITIFFLRIAIGWLLFYSGFGKLLSGFSAKGFLLNLHGTFSAFFLPLAGNNLVDGLVVWGELLIGLCLILGLLVRFAGFWGIVMMLLFYFASFPPKHAFLIDEHIIYALILVFFMVSNAGHFWGLDKKLEKVLPQLKLLMG